MEGNAEFLKAGEAACMLHITASTLANWDRSGVLKPDRRLASGHRLYRRESLEKFIEERCEVRSQ